MPSSSYFGDPTRAWEAFRQIHPDAVGWLKSQLEVSCYATRRRAAEMLSISSNFADGDHARLSTQEHLELEYYHRGGANFLAPEERHVLKDALLIALETAEEEGIRADAARTLGEIDAREAIVPLRALQASLSDRIGSPLEEAVSGALFQLDPPAWARPATYILLLIAVVPIVLLVVLMRRR
jgi:hypothetical protein